MNSAYYEFGGFMKDNINSALNWRYAVKKFDPTQKIPQDVWKTLRESLRLAPSSYGLQPWKFIEVQDPSLRQQLRTHSWNQAQVTDSSHYVVLCYHSNLDAQYIHNYIQFMAQERGLNPSVLEGFEKTMAGDLLHGPRSTQLPQWAQRQVYIAMGFALLAASLLQVDACPMEGIDPLNYDKVLGLGNTPYRSVAAIAFGYRDPSDALAQAKKVRFPESQVWEIK